jgi:hypothetical protein
LSIKKRLLAGATSLALAVGVASAATSASAVAPPPVDVSNNSVYCDSLVGGIKFSVALTLGGTSPNTISIKATVSGCVDQTAGLFDSDTNPDGVSLAPSKMSAVISSATNDCLGLQGLSEDNTGDAVIQWKGNTKDLLGNSIPKIISDDPSGKAISTVAVGQTYGGTYVPEGFDSTDNEPVAWDAGHSGYGMFQIGADDSHHNTEATSVAGAYSLNGGANGYFDGTTGESQSSIGGACFGKGVKKIAFGNGQIFFG